MEDLIEKLQRAYQQQLQDVLAIEDNDRLKTQKRIQALKEVLEELEIVAAAATPVVISNSNDELTNHNPNILTGDFYASYLIILLLAKNLNGARFLWKRIDAATKASSQTLRNVWEIGKGFWQRDFSAAYQAMRVEWPETLQPLIGLLQQSTRETATELLSEAYTTISCADAMIALGFDDQASLVQYVEGLGWNITEQWLHPTALSYARSQASSLDQLETISNYVLHLEQTTLLNLT